MFDYFELLLGFIATLVTAYAGYQKYLDEKQFNHYKDNIKNLFSPQKDEVLASVATLGVYKNRMKYKKSTVDTLLNLLYTELDYDICNAIIGVLAQASRESEFRYISEKLIEINRNFFVQTYPLNVRQGDLKSRYEKIEKTYLKALTNGDEKPLSSEQAMPKEIMKTWKESIEKRWISLKDINDFKLKWHKQVIGDVLAMILNKAAKADLIKKLRLNFNQNEFNYCLFDSFTLEEFSIRRSAISSTTLTNISFNNLKLIEDSTFAFSNFIDCRFSGGTMIDSPFTGATFEAVKFENINFRNTYFIDSSFYGCEFRNVKGLSPHNFYGAIISGNTLFDSGFEKGEISQLNDEKMKDHFANSDMSNNRKKELTEYLWPPKQQKPSQKTEPAE